VNRCVGAGASKEEGRMAEREGGAKGMGREEGEGGYGGGRKLTMRGDGPDGG